VVSSPHRTDLDLRPMLGDFYLHGRQIEDLAFLIAGDRHLGQRCVAVITFCHRMDLDVVGLFYRLQASPGVARLPAGLLLTRASQTSRAWHRRFLVPVAGGWLAAVAAVFGQLIPQRLDRGSLLLNLGCLLFHRLLLTTNHISLFIQAPEEPLDDDGQGSQIRRQCRRNRQRHHLCHGQRTASGFINRHVVAMREHLDSWPWGEYYFHRITAG